LATAATLVYFHLSLPRLAVGNPSLEKSSIPFRRIARSQSGAAGDLALSNSWNCSWYRWYRSNV
jgi:hypothetical protein